MLARFPEMAAMAEPGGVMRPGIVHRLDKDTSGVMVVARTPFARMELARQFKERTVSKIYLAVVRGVIGRERFSIMRPVGRHPVERKRMSVNSRHGREAAKRGLRARANARGGGRRDARRSAAADRPHASDSRTPVPRSGIRALAIRSMAAASTTGSRDATLADAASSFKRQALHALALRSVIRAPVRRSNSSRRRRTTLPAF